MVLLSKIFMRFAFKENPERLHYAQNSPQRLPSIRTKFLICISGQILCTILVGNITTNAQ